MASGDRNLVSGGKRRRDSDEDEEDEDEGRKRSRMTKPADDTTSSSEARHPTAQPVSKGAHSSNVLQRPDSTTAKRKSQETNVDREIVSESSTHQTAGNYYDREVFDALDLELEDLARADAVRATLEAEPTVSANPLSAAEMAAQAREEESAPKGRRETELEDEREDASRQVQEEVSRMQELDERMKALRERRDALRHAVNGKPPDMDSAQSNTGNDAESKAQTSPSGPGSDHESDSDEEEEEGDEWAVFRE